MGIPGVWKGDWYVDNAKKTRHAKGNSPSWKPLAYDLSIFHEGDRMISVLAPREAQRSIAEAVAFGGALCRCIEGRMLERLVAGQPDAVASWQAMGDYNDFTMNHQELYIGSQPESHILLLGGFDASVDRMLLRTSVQYDTRLHSRLSLLDEGKKYAAVLVPPNLEISAPVLKGSPGTSRARRQAFGLSGTP